MSFVKIPFEKCIEKTKILFKLKKKDYLEKGKYPVVSQEASLISGYHDNVSDIIKVTKPVVIFGDHTQIIKYVDFDFVVGADGAKVLRPIDKINTKYFYYVLKSLMPKHTGYARHFKFLKKLIIPVPSINEQKYIVEKLDLISNQSDEALKLLTDKQAELEKLKAAILTKMLEGKNYKNVKLGNVLTIARGGSPRPIKSFLSHDSQGVNWIKIGDTTVGSKYIYKTKQKIKKAGITRSRYVKSGDFLLSNSMSYGRPYILKIDGCIHDGWLVFTEYKENFIIDYLYYLLSSSIAQNQFKKLARGATVDNLNRELVSNVIVPVPSLSEQEDIIRKLSSIFNNIDEMSANIKKNKNNYTILKSTLIKQKLQLEKTK